MFIDAFEVRVPTRTIQDVIDKELPLSGEAFGASYSVPAARVTLRQDGRVQVSADLVIGGGRSSIPATMVGSGEILYRNSAFYIAGFLVESYEFGTAKVHDGDRMVVEGLADKVLSFTGIGKNVLTELIDLAQTPFKEKFPQLVSGLIQGCLDDRAIYQLEGRTWMETVAKMAVSNVAVEKDRLVITVQPGQMVGRVALAAILLVVAGFSLFGFR